MKVLKYALVIGAAIGAVSANAQFGAATKGDVTMSGNKQGLFLAYNPFTRTNANGGGTQNGYLVAIEKGISEGKNGPGVLGGWFSRIGGSNIYDITYRMYMEPDASVGLGVLGGDGFNGKNDFTLMYFKDMMKTQGSPLDWQLFGGLMYDSADKSTNFTGGVKLSYPVQQGFAIDASFWYLHNGGTSGNMITVGVSYRN